MRKALLPVGAFSAAIAVALGAFGAHGLRNALSPELLAVFETGVRYQMYHAFGMMVVGVLIGLPFPLRSGLLVAAGWTFLAGSILFSGSLYILALTDVRWVAFITPLGGIGFIAGWILLGLSPLMQSRTRN